MRRRRSRGAAVTTVLAAHGYPEKPRTGVPIQIPANMQNVVVFHAGTALRDTGELVATGGRVLGVTGIADSFERAQHHSRAAAEQIEFEGKHFRTDIGWRERERTADSSLRSE